MATLPTVADKKKGLLSSTQPCGDCDVVPHHGPTDIENRTQRSPVEELRVCPQGKRTESGVLFSELCGLYVVHQPAPKLSSSFQPSPLSPHGPSKLQARKCQLSVWSTGRPEVISTMVFLLCPLPLGERCSLSHAEQSASTPGGREITETVSEKSLIKSQQLNCSPKATFGDSSDSSSVESSQDSWHTRNYENFLRIR